VDDMTQSEPAANGAEPALRCECFTWARTDGRLTTHHPLCGQFKEERFYRARLNGEGIGYIVPHGDIGIIVGEVGELDEGDTLTVDVVRMTQEEHDALPEFDGF
jgi:hypothetical protein